MFGSNQLVRTSCKLCQPGGGLRHCSNLMGDSANPLLQGNWQANHNPYEVPPPLLQEVTPVPPQPPPPSDCKWAQVLQDQRVRFHQTIPCMFTLSYAMCKFQKISSLPTMPWLFTRSFKMHKYLCEESIHKRHSRVICQIRDWCDQISHVWPLHRDTCAS